MAQLLGSIYIPNTMAPRAMEDTISHPHLVYETFIGAFKPVRFVSKDLGQEDEKSHADENTFEPMKLWQLSVPPTWISHGIGWETLGYLGP